MAQAYLSDVSNYKVDPPAAVIDAFRDVQAARADQERLRNEAEAYSNRIIPAARGEAAQLMEAAEAYKNSVIAEPKVKHQDLTQFMKNIEKHQKLLEGGCTLKQSNVCMAEWIRSL